MTKEEISEGKKLIAVFMEGKPKPPFYTVDTWDIPNMPGYQYVLYYDSSWDWLMPVVNKCKKTNELAYNGSNIMSALLSLDINQLFNSVVEFIKWYNESQKLNER